MEKWGKKADSTAIFDRKTNTMRTLNMLLFLAGLGAQTLSANAQFSKGDRMVGATLGSLVYNSGNTDISVDQVGSNTSNTTNYNLNLAPNMGWFIAANTAVGASVVLNPASSKVSYEQNGSTFQRDNSKTFNIGLGAFIRHYLKNNTAWMPYGQFGFNLGISSLKTDGVFYGGSGANAYKLSYDGSSSGGFYANAGFQAGLTRMIGANAGLDLFLGYTYGYNNNTFEKTTLRDIGNDGSVDETLKNKTTTKFTNHGFIIGAGFQVFIRGKKK